MNNQKTSTSLHQEFVRKPKRRQSPKQKNQNLHSFKCHHKENINVKQKEENHLTENQVIKNDTEIVLDLKHQLSHLRQQMAKIAHSKMHSGQSDKNGSKLKMLDYYFSDKPDKNDKKSQSNLGNITNGQVNNNKRQQGNDLSLQKQLKKLGSKERLKFSKLKKVDKFSPISSVKKKGVDGSLKSIQSEQLIKQDGISRKKSVDESTLQEDMRRISLQHRSKLQQQIKSLVSDKQNVLSNIDMTQKCQQQQIKQSKQSSCSLSTKGKQTTVVSPRGNVVSSQIKIKRLKKKVQEQQLQIETLKRVIKEKTDVLGKYILQLELSKQAVMKIKVEKQTQQNQIITLRKQLSYTIQQKNNQFQQSIKIKQLFTKLQQDNTKLKQQLQKNLQKLNNNEQQINTIKTQHNQLVDSIKKQFALKQTLYQQEIVRINKIINELKINKPKPTLVPNQSSLIKIPKQQSLLIPPQQPTSPRGSITPTNRQKELLNIIRLHQKSQQNYQKDLSFLQSQCKSLHLFKILSKKQQNLIKQTNFIIVNQQLAKLNNKYQKRPISFSPTPKQFIKKGTKQKSNEN